MESGFEDDFAPMQSSNGVVPEDSSFILGHYNKRTRKRKVEAAAAQKSSENGVLVDNST